MNANGNDSQGISKESESKKLARRLEQSYREVLELKEKAETANRLKSQYLAIMSHDIRTPLNSIMGFTDLISKEECSGKSRDYIDKIKRSGTALLALLNDILDFSRIEAGQLEIFRETFALKQLLDSIVPMFELQARQEHIEFSVHFETGIPERLNNDQWRIYQVLINLLSNAFKFTEKGNVNLRISYNKGADMLVFNVIDTGTGIERHLLEKIFQPFTQVGKAGTGKKKGTGLGLAICGNLVKLMGGHIVINSEPGKGTRATVEFPVNSDKITEEAQIHPGNNAAETETPDDASSRKTANTILIVDDNEVNLELIVEQFKSEGFYSLLTADSGSRAIELALEKKPDMILMDIQMPGMDGNEAIRQLRQRGYRRPIIAISAYAMKEETQRTLELGADDYITKPIDFDAFFNRVGKFLTTGTGDGNRIKATVSDRIRGVFLKDARKKLDRLEEILASGDFASAKGEVEVIAHTYKGNASYMGLKDLEVIAREIDRAFKKGEPDRRLSALSRRMADVLHNIITPRRGDPFVEP